MAKSGKRSSPVRGTVLLLIAAAYGIKVFSSRWAEPNAAWLIVGLLRSGIYIGLFAVWGASVRHRVVQPQVRHYLSAISALFVFWMAVRTAKYFIFFRDPLPSRYLWYSYYIPQVLIPLMLVFIACSLGKPENYRLPKWTNALYAVSGTLLGLILTNDLHQLAFAFANGLVHFESGEYVHGIIYFLAIGWMLICVLAMLVMLYRKCRVPGSKKRIWRPCIPTFLLVVYSATYLLAFPILVRVQFRDFSVVSGLLCVAMLESCIRCGLIPSNTRYAELFSSADIKAMIVDGDYAVHYASKDAAPLPEADMRRTESGPVMLPGGVQLQGMPVPGGHVLWTADLSELLRLQQELEEINDELTERNEALCHQYEEEQKHRRVLEQNRLYDALQNQTQHQINEIYALVKAYRKAPDADGRQMLLTRIILLGSFVKRRKDFVLSASITPLLPESKLKNALSESYRALALMGVTGTCTVDTSRELVEVEALTAAYDFFQQFVEAALGSLRSVNVTVSTVNGGLRERIFADCLGDFSSLKTRWPKLALEQEDDGVTAVLMLEGGEAR